MKKNIIIICYSVVLVVLFKLAFTFGYNEWVISKYEEEDYSENFSLLEMFNVNEPYIVYYNNGNVMYQRMDYEAAIEYYEKALANNPPEGKECPIRINLALAKLALLEDDWLSEEKIEDSIELLEECLDTLSEDECATEDGDGHDNRAQRLYDEIKELLDQAEQEQQQQEESKQQESQQNSDDSNSDSNNSDNSDNSDQSNNSDESSENSDGSDSSDDEESRKASESEREASESQRQDEIESEMSQRMDKSNDQRQEERRKNIQQGEEWNWNYDDQPVW